MIIIPLLTVLFAAIAFLILIFIMFLFLTRKPYPTIKRHDPEKYFEDPATRLKCPFPSFTDMPEVSLSVIIPAFNEESRLPLMLEECLEYLERRTRNEPKFTYEIIVVNDGSSDKTVDVAMQYVHKYGSDKFRLLDLIENRGKGGAVRLGVMSSRGGLILFADADGATRFSDLDKIYSSLNVMLTKANSNTDKGSEWKVPLIVVGSRAHLEQESISQRSFFRTVLMYGFHALVWTLTVRGVGDTQCGFKLFTRSAARLTFPSLHIERWAFDVELLYIAQKLSIPIEEVAVYWTEIEGSKITPFWSWIQMGRDLVLIWLRYRIGAWKLITKGE